MSGPPLNPGVAAVLSLVIPGVGQIYNGDFLRGVFWLVITARLFCFALTFCQMFNRSAMRW